MGGERAKVRGARHTEQALVRSAGRGNVAEAEAGGNQIPEHLTFVRQMRLFPLNIIIVKLSRFA